VLENKVAPVSAGAVCRWIRRDPLNVNGYLDTQSSALPLLRRPQADAYAPRPSGHSSVRWSLPIYSHTPVPLPAGTAPTHEPRAVPLHTVPLCTCLPPVSYETHVSQRRRTWCVLL